MRIPALILPTLVAVAGCAGQAPQRDAAAAQGPDALYAAIAPAVERYREGGRALASGDAVGAAEREAAVATLQESAAACAADPACDSRRFFAAYESLLAADAEIHPADGGATPLRPSGEGSPILAELPQAGRTVNLLNGRELRDVIALNGPVKAALVEWLTWMRPQLVDAWENYQYLRHRMWPEYERAGLPEALLFGILAKESAGKVHAVSRAGASGPLQFMPATGRRFGLVEVDGFDTRFDPQASARANVAYLNERFAEFNHNLELSLAAYNGGEGRVARLHRGARTKSFWDPDLYWALPQETRDYVPMVLAAAWLFLHPEDYGLEFPVVAPAPATLVLEQPASLNELTICLGSDGARNGWFRTLRNLNPRYMPDTALAAGTGLAVPERVLPLYRERCLSGGLADTAKVLAQAHVRAPARPVARTVTVHRGDSLNAIARRHGCPLDALASANGLRPPSYLIRVGQELKLVGCRG